MKARLPDSYRGGGQAAMLKQIQQMQEDMASAQTEIENTVFTASVGGGAVQVEVSGKHELLSVRLKPEVVDPDDIEMLQDLIQAAVNEAMTKASETMEQRMQALQGAMPPGLSGLMG
ncbi:MAG: YbaB/EbfC family nucleoid-associated protein [Oscillospiraceae bacterium]|nr:YbaB/EbfC family nucleoid-associated protein [Oscillospiraceae bacterium]